MFDAMHPLGLSELEVLIRARYPLIYVVSWEEHRVLREVTSIGVKLTKKVWEWTGTRGLARYRAQVNPGRIEGVKGTKDPVVALRTVLEETEPSIFVFKDLHQHFKDAAVKRALRDLAEWLPQTLMTLVILSPTLDVPNELSKDLTVVDYPLPSREELTELLESIIRDVADNPAFQFDSTREGRDRLIDSALGLTLKEAENVFAKTLILRSKLTADQVDVVNSEKKQLIRKSGLLEYLEPSDQLDAIGGLENLKEWLRKRRRGFTAQARQYGLPLPKGVLFVGVQGCGKSLCAKAVANEWRMPLLRMDAGMVFGRFVGESESNMRQTIKLAEGVAPAILWVDEIDKGFSGLMDGSGDSGTTRRVFGSFITWMQEKTGAVFVIATANAVENLPAELLRKGRFDEIFFVDLPGEAERRDILKIHMARRKRTLTDAQLNALAVATEGFSGAELEQVIVAGMFQAFEENAEVSGDHLMRAVEETFPLSKTMREQIEARRKWAVGRARPASADRPPVLQ